jgi:HlyD family secretion protein
MKKIVLVLLAAVFCALLYWYATKPKPVAVVLGTVAKGEIAKTVVNTKAGTVKALRRALLAPPIGGQIEQLRAKKGMRVKEGDVLLSLWNKDLAAQVALSKSDVLAAEATAKSTCLGAGIAKRQAERYRFLGKGKIVSEDEADRIISTASVQEASCESARTTVAVRQGQLQAAEAHLQQTVLYAPFAGIVADVNGEVGEFATPSPPGIPTLPAVDLVDDSGFYVSAPIDEVDASAIRVGMEAKITMDAFSGRTFAGRVQRIAAFVLDREKQARTVDIEVAFAGGEELPQLLPGYSADAEVIIQTKKDVLRIPSEAVSPGGKVFVFHQTDSRLEERAVTTGLANLEFTEVTAGLKPGERIVLSADRKGVKAGALVKEEGTAPPAGR